MTPDALDHPAIASKPPFPGQVEVLSFQHKIGEHYIGRSAARILPVAKSLTPKRLIHANDVHTCPQMHA